MRTRVWHECEVLTLILAPKPNSRWGGALILTHSWCSMLSRNWWNNTNLTRQLHHNSYMSYERKEIWNKAPTVAFPDEWATVEKFWVVIISRSLMTSVNMSVKVELTTQRIKQRIDAFVSAQDNKIRSYIANYVCERLSIYCKWHPSWIRPVLRN